MAVKRFSRIDRANLVMRALRLSEVNTQAGARIIERIFAESAEPVLWWWFLTVFPGHFKLGAARKYKYKKRAYKYQQFKRRRKPKGGLEDPPLPALVYTGRWKRLATAAPLRDPHVVRRARGLYMQIKINVKPYVRMNKYVPLVNEATRLIPSERAKIMGMIRQIFIDKLGGK